MIFSRTSYSLVGYVLLSRGCSFKILSYAEEYLSPCILPSFISRDFFRKQQRYTPAMFWKSTVILYVLCRYNGQIGDLCPLNEIKWNALESGDSSHLILVTGSTRCYHCVRKPGREISGCLAEDL